VPRCRAAAASPPAPQTPPPAGVTAAAATQRRQAATHADVWRQCITSMQNAAAAQQDTAYNVSSRSCVLSLRLLRTSQWGHLGESHKAAKSSWDHPGAVEPLQGCGGGECQWGTGQRIVMKLAAAEAPAGGRRAQRRRQQRETGTPNRVDCITRMSSMRCRRRGWGWTRSARCGDSAAGAVAELVCTRRIWRGCCCCCCCCCFCILLRRAALGLGSAPYGAAKSQRRPLQQAGDAGEAAGGLEALQRGGIAPHGQADLHTGHPGTCSW
jgi:hypothetical protein